MAEGDTILRAARQIEAALGGQRLGVATQNPRGPIAGIDRLERARLDRVEARGKHLLLRFGDLVLHSHLGMSGSWQVCRRGERWRKPRSAAWLALDGESMEAIQFGGPTLRLLTSVRLRRDPVLARLGPDVLGPAFDPVEALGFLRAAADRELGDALLDQRLIAGIGNVFKSEACFAAAVSPWRRIGDSTDGELRAVLVQANRLMRDSVEGSRAEPRVYRRAGRPCPRCCAQIASRGQGDANRRTYWCPRCQAGERRAK